MLSLADVIVISHPAPGRPASSKTLSPERERMECTPFNVFCGKGSLVGVSICLLINGKACLKMQVCLAG